MVLMEGGCLQSSTLLKGGCRNENTEKCCAGEGDLADDLVRGARGGAEDVAKLQPGRQGECERAGAEGGGRGRALGHAFSASYGDGRATQVHDDGGRRVRYPSGKSRERCGGVPHQPGRLT